MDLFKAIAEFHLKYELPKSPKPSPLSTEISDFRKTFMYEELEEYLVAVANRDLEGQLDALVDLTYVVLGTAYLHGFDFNEAFRRVHEANMKKIRAELAAESKRGSTFDVVKPAGWVAPDLSDLVGK